MDEDIAIINQNTRVSLIKKFFKENSKKILSFIFIIIALLLIYFAYDEFEKRKKINLAATYNSLIFNTDKFSKEEIKNKIIDDCNLAKIIKDSGNHIWLGLTNLVESQRNYSKLEQIWKMITRTAYEQLNNSILVLIVSIIGMVMIYLMPFINLIHQNSINLIIINLASIFLMFLSFLPTAKFYNLNFVFYFSLPISSIIYMLMTINSAYNYYFKNGNVWKGRKY